MAPRWEWTRRYPFLQLHSSALTWLRTVVLAYPSCERSDLGCICETVDFEICNFLPCLDYCRSGVDPDHGLACYVGSLNRGSEGVPLVVAALTVRCWARVCIEDGCRYHTRMGHAGYVFSMHETNITFSRPFLHTDTLCELSMCASADTCTLRRTTQAQSRRPWQARNATNAHDVVRLTVLYRYILY